MQSYIAEHRRASSAAVLLSYGMFLPSLLQPTPTQITYGCKPWSLRLYRKRYGERLEQCDL